MNEDYTQSPSKKSNVAQQSIHPLTIKQYMECEHMHPDAPFLVDGSELTVIKFVGCVRKSKPSAIGTNYTIEDGTGSVEATIWKPQGEEPESIPEGTWVKVIGKPRMFNSKKDIKVTKIVPLEDFNEFTFHMLQAIHAHFYHMNGGQTLSAPKIQNIAQSVVFTGDSFSPIQQSCLQGFGESNSPEGLHIGSVVRRLQNQFPEKDLVAAIDWLIDEGHLYTTIDENHAKCTS